MSKVETDCTFNLGFFRIVFEYIGVKIAKEEMNKISFHFLFCEDKIFNSVMVSVHLVQCNFNQIN